MPSLFASFWPLQINVCIMFLYGFMIGFHVAVSLSSCKVGLESIVSIRFDLRPVTKEMEAKSGNLTGSLKDQDKLGSLVPFVIQITNGMKILEILGP